MPLRGNGPCENSVVPVAAVEIYAGPESLPTSYSRNLLAIVVCETPNRLPSCRLLGCSEYRRSSTAFSNRPTISSNPPMSLRTSDAQAESVDNPRA